MSIAYSFGRRGSMTFVMAAVNSADGGDGVTGRGLTRRPTPAEAYGLPRLLLCNHRATDGGGSRKFPDSSRLQCAGSQFLDILYAVVQYLFFRI